MEDQLRRGLLSQAPEARKRALDECIARSHDHVLACAMRKYRAGPENANVQDLIQNTWARALERLGQFRGASLPEFRGWVGAILHSVYVNGLGEDRRRARSFAGAVVSLNGAPGGPAFEPPAPGPTPSGIVMGQEAREQLERALRLLSDRERELLHLRLGEGLGHEEIGALLGLDREKCRQACHDVLKKLRRWNAEEAL